MKWNDLLFFFFSSFANRMARKSIIMIIKSVQRLQQRAAALEAYTVEEESRTEKISLAFYLVAYSICIWNSSDTVFYVCVSFHGTVCVWVVCSFFIVSPNGFIMKLYDCDIPNFISYAKCTTADADENILQTHMHMA